MDCRTAEEWIQARFDGALDVEHGIELGSHLALCPVCRQVWSDLERLCGAVRELPEIAAGVLARNALARLDCRHAVAASFPAQATEGSRLHRRWAVGLATSAAALIGLIFFLHPHAAPINTARTAEKPAAPTRSTENVETTLPGPQSGEELLKALIAQRYLAESRKPEAERRREREHADLLRDLHRTKCANAAAAQLLDHNPDNATIWAVAASVADPATGGEIFSAAARLKPNLRLAPIYIAALDSVHTRARAAELLCSASGKRWGAQKDVWLAWWAAARSQVRND